MQIHPPQGPPGSASWTIWFNHLIFFPLILLALVCIWTANSEGSWGTCSMNKKQRPFSFTSHLSSFLNSIKFLILFILSGGIKFMFQQTIRRSVEAYVPGLLSSWFGSSQDGWDIFTPFSERTYKTWWCLGINLPRPAEGGSQKNFLLVWLKLSMNHREDFKGSGKCFQKEGFSTVPTV